MALHVYFYGLIAFIGDQKKTDAVLITYPGHRPEIVTAADRTTAHDGARVVFDGADGYGADMTNAFSSYIPELSRVIKPAPLLKSEVVQHTDQTFVSAYLKLPAGKLQVADFYDVQGQFAFNGTVARPPGCIGRLTYLQIVTASPVVVLGGTKQISCPPDGWVLVQNTCAKGGKDFKAHRHITDAKSDTEVATLTEAGPCDISKTWPTLPFYGEIKTEIQREVFDLGQIECSSSRWP